MTLLEDNLKIKDNPQLKFILIKSWIEHPMITKLEKASLAKPELGPAKRQLFIIIFYN
jgi:hypothetical protein